MGKIKLRWLELNSNQWNWKWFEVNQIILDNIISVYLKLNKIKSILKIESLEKIHLVLGVWIQKFRKITKEEKFDNIEPFSEILQKSLIKFLCIKMR